MDSFRNCAMDSFIKSLNKILSESLPRIPIVSLLRTFAKDFFRKCSRISCRSSRGSSKKFKEQPLKKFLWVSSGSPPCFFFQNSEISFRKSSFSSRNPSKVFFRISSRYSFKKSWNFFRNFPWDTFIHLSKNSIKKFSMDCFQHFIKDFCRTLPSETPLRISLESYPGIYSGSSPRIDQELLWESHIKFPPECVQ